MKKLLSILLFVIVLLFITGCVPALPSENDEYTVTFVTNCDQTIENIKVKKGEKINNPIELVKEGYTFDGWYYNEVKWDFIIDVVTEDMTLVAKWNEIIDETIKCTNLPDELVLFVGDVLQLNFQKNSNNCNNELNYSVSDTLVINVDNKGVVTALSEGSAQVIAVDKNNENNTCIVNIVVEKIKLESIKISGKTLVTVGESEQFEVVMNPLNYKGEIIWSVSDESCAKIDPETGVLTGLREIPQLYIFATSKEFPEIRGQKKICIKANENITENEHPDLQGYTIKIAVSENEISKYNPFNFLYNSIDKKAKSQAWEEVEELYNCDIEVISYPSAAEFGSSRWNYIISQTQMNVGDYDFCVVPDSAIPTLVKGGAIISLEDFYITHCNGLMDSSLVVAGSYEGNLYGLPGLYNGNYKNNISSIIGYNIGLLEKLQQVDPALKDPAQIFNEGDWTYEAFQSYIKQVQDAMTKAYGIEGTAGSENQKYYAVSGWDAYWWTGLASNDGEPIADIQTMRVNLNTPHKLEAANVVKYMYENNYADPYQNIDQNVTSWNEGLSLFNTGELWFIGDDTRWSKDLWGEDTRYGYVPWPRANDVEFEDIRVAMGGTATCVMPTGRDYSQYGEDCTPENIFAALAELLLRTKKYMDIELSSNKDELMMKEAAKYAHSEASQEAYLYIQGLIENDKGYFDPLVNPINRIEDLYLNQNTYLGVESLVTIKTAVNKYCVTKSVATWDEAIATLQPVLTENLRKNFS